MDIIGNIYSQNCGDSLVVVEASNKKSKDGHILYKCEFQKYPYITFSLKKNILAGGVNNPMIEEEEFIKKKWPQNCGDFLKILGKSWDEKAKRWNFDVEFIKYPYIKRGVRKTVILAGTVNNPQIEQVEFLSKEWEQNCGDSLKIIYKKGELYKCQFLTYFSEVWAYKNQIKKGSVDNPNLPWKTKEGLNKYIKENFEKFPTLNELSYSLKIHSTTLGQAIDRFELKHLINYYPSYSLEETKLQEILSNFVEIETSNWSILDGKEIDIYISKFNLGIEFNGSYWHSELFKKQNYHQEKSLLCQSKGISLIHIWEYEWNVHKDIVIDLLKNKLGIFNKKVGARQCKIKEISNNIYQEFCNKNHLQGYCNAKIKLGLLFKEELIQIMSFDYPRFARNIEWEIIRECSKLGYIVIGGKEKLWSYFIKNYHPNSVISYCDFSKFTGDSYLRLGFKKERLNKPGFVWWDKVLNTTYLRTPWKHQEMKNKGYYKIYDAGQLVFVWNK